MNKKRILMGLGAFAFLGLTTVLTSCGGEKTYTVKFLDGQTELSSSTVTSGYNVEVPTAPTSDGKIFNGWYADEALTKPFDFGSIIEGDTNVYAAWVNEFTVTFKDGSKILSSTTVTSGYNVKAPANPTAKSGKTFAGWFADAALTKPFNFGSVITSATTVYAKWDSVYHNVNLYLDANTLWKTVAIEEGETLDVDGTPTVKYKVFDNKWYTNSNCNDDTLFNLGNEITEEINLYAGWTADYESVTEGAGNSKIAGLVTWSDAQNIAGTTGVITQDLTIGSITFVNNNKATFNVKNNADCFNTQGGNIKVSLTGEGNNNEIHGNGLWASTSTKGYVRLYKVGEDGSETLVKEEGKFESDGAEVKYDWTNLETGEYIIKNDASVRYFDIYTTQKKAKSAPASIQVLGARSQFMVGEEFASDGLSCTLKYANGSSSTVLSGYQVVSSNFDNTKAGVYTITVKYSVTDKYDDVYNFEDTYDVKVYAVTQLAVGDYTLSSSRVTQNLEQVFTTTDTFANKNLSVVATATCPVGDKTETVTFELSSDQYTVEDPTITTTGEKEVKVKLASDVTKVATYKVEVLDKLVAENGYVMITVDPTAEIEVAGNEATVNTINQALQLIKKSNIDKNVTKNIAVKPGEYKEKVEIDMPNVYLINDAFLKNDGSGFVDNFYETEITDANRVTIWYDALAEYKINGQAHSTDGSATFSVRSTATNFNVAGITFKNYYNTHELYLQSKKLVTKDTQAVALLVEADQALFVNCEVSSYHDTLYAREGRQMYYHCYIEGRTDYIFGDRDVTAYFRDCTIHTLGADQDKNGGYVACNKGSKVDLAYIFDGCTFEADAATEVEGVKKGVADATVSLGRTWDADMRLVIMNSTISSAYATADFKAETEGGKNTRYTEMNKDKSPSKTKIFEYNNSGEGAITSAQAANYISVSVLSEISEDNAKYVTNDFAKMFSNNGTKEWSDSATWINGFLFMQTTPTTYLFDDMGLTQVEPVVITVEFNGTSYHFVTVKNGYISEQQVKKVLADYITNYGGSYSDEACTTSFVFTNKVTENKTIYTKYQDGFPVSYTMSYDGSKKENAGFETKGLTSTVYLSPTANVKVETSAKEGYDAVSYLQVKKNGEGVRVSEDESYIKANIFGRNAKSVNVSIYGGSNDTGDPVELAIKAYNKDDTEIGCKLVTAGAKVDNKKVTRWASSSVVGGVTEENYETVSATEAIAYIKVYLTGVKGGQTNYIDKKWALSKLNINYVVNEYNYNFDFNASDTEEADTAMEKNYQVAADLSLQGTTGTGTIGDDFIINVDATEGKLAARTTGGNNDTQFNKDTKLSFVAPYDCEVELVLRGGSASINGITNGTKRVVQRFAAGTAVEIVALENSYLTSLSIKKVETVTPFAATSITAETTTTELAQNATFAATTLTVKATNTTTGYYKTLSADEYQLSPIDTTTTGEKTITVTYGTLTDTFSFNVVASVNTKITTSTVLDYKCDGTYSSDITNVLDHNSGNKLVSTTTGTTQTFDNITYGNGAASAGTHNWLTFNQDATISFEMIGSGTVKLYFMSGTPNVSVKLGDATITTNTPAGDYHTGYAYVITEAGVVTITGTNSNYIGFIEIIVD